MTLKVFLPSVLLLILVCINEEVKAQPIDPLRIKINDEEAQNFDTRAAYLDHKNKYVDRAESMDIDPVIGNNWYRSKVNIAKDKEFRRIGVDLHEMAAMTNHMSR